MRIFSKALLVFSLLSAICFLQVRYLRLSLTPSRSASDESIRQSQLTKTQLEIISTMPTLGFDNVLSDWAFLQFLQYFGDTETRELIGYGLSSNFFEVITTYDPRFVDTYLYLTNAVSVYAGQPQKAIQLMEQGLSVMSPDIPPTSYFVWRYKGTDEMLFVGDNQSAQNSFQTAADWARRSSDPRAPLVAKLSQETAAFLATDPNSRPARINGWMNVLSRAINDDVRQEALAQIEALGGEVLFNQNGQVTVRYTTDE